MFKYHMITVIKMHNIVVKHYYLSVKQLHMHNKHDIRQQVI